jgi:hypothetical protein
MFFSAKNSSFFVEKNDHTFLIARVSSEESPIVIEEVRECPSGDSAAVAETIRQIRPKKSSGGYLKAGCAVYPTDRVVRRATLDLKRMKESGYLPEVLTQQLRIEPEKYAVHMINASNGADAGSAPQKEVLFCGLPSENINTIQDELLAAGIYPENLELGSVATLGGLVDYLSFKNSKVPTLVLEIGPDVTQSYIVSSAGVDASRPIAQGLQAMVPVVQKELGLKDEESAKKLFYSNTFDFTGMGPLLTKKLLKELQSSIGFYEVQTGQSVGQIVCSQLPPKLGWLENVIATALGVARLEFDLTSWLQSRQVSVASTAAPSGLDVRWFGLLSLMVRYNSSPDALAVEKKV